MSKTLEQMLGYVPLTGLIKRVKTGIPDVLPPAFRRVTKRVVGDSGRYTVKRGTRALARRVEYGASALFRGLKDTEERDIKLFHSFECIRIKPLVFQALRNFTDYNMQQRGEDEIDYQEKEFAAYFDNLSLTATYSMLANGKIWWDGSGNLLPSSSGAVVTTDFLMNANNQAQLNGIITASWKFANTDIPSQIRNLRLRAAELTGYPLKYAFYGTNIPSYLTQNNYVLEYLSRNVNLAQKFLDSAELPNLFDLTWVPVYTAFFEDQNGVNQTIFSGDTVVFTPEIDQETYDFLEGSFLVPTSFNAAGNALAAIRSLKEVYGRFSYAAPWHNPPSVDLFAGFTESPTIKVPDAYFQANVAP